jgi:atypical dual specificity phosphatase
MYFPFFFLAPLLLILIKNAGLLPPHLVNLLPRWFRYPATVVLFWPQVLSTRLFCFMGEALRCSSVRLLNRVSPSLVLGVAPVFPSFVEALFAEHNVRGVINLCAEWDGNAVLYAARGIQQLYLPTIDFEAPALKDVLRALAFIDAHERRGFSTYIHCKAGRGRSAIVALAYFVVKQGMSPQAADALVRAKRPNISRGKAELPLFKELLAHREALAAAGR